MNTFDAEIPDVEFIYNHGKIYEITLKGEVLCSGCNLDTTRASSLKSRILNLGFKDHLTVKTIVSYLELIINMSEEFDTLDFGEYTPRINTYLCLMELHVSNYEHRNGFLTEDDKAEIHRLVFGCAILIAQTHDDYQKKIDKFYQ